MLLDPPVHPPAPASPISTSTSITHLHQHLTTSTPAFPTASTPAILPAFLPASPQASTPAFPPTSTVYTSISTSIANSITNSQCCGSGSGSDPDSIGSIGSVKLWKEVKLSYKNLLFQHIFHEFYIFLKMTLYKISLFNKIATYLRFWLEQKYLSQHSGSGLPIIPGSG